MKRNTIIYLAIFIFLFLGINDSALAVSTTSFSEIWTVRGDKETDPYDSFGWDETPWLYIKLPSSPGLFWKSSVTSDWLFSGIFQGSSDSDQSSRSYWLSLSDWNTFRQAGEWTINADFTYSRAGSDPITGSGSAIFNVSAVPEPVSSALFVLGGLMLAAKKLRRKK